MKLSEPSLSIYCKLLKSRDQILIFTFFFFLALWAGGLDHETRSLNVGGMNGPDLLIFT